MCSWGFGPEGTPPCSGDPRSPHLGVQGLGFRGTPGRPAAGLAVAGSGQHPARLVPGIPGSWGAAAGGVEGPRPPTGKCCIHPGEAARGSCRPGHRSGAEGTGAEIRDREIRPWASLLPQIQGPGPTRNKDSGCMPKAGFSFCVHSSERSTVIKRSLTSQHGQVGQVPLGVLRKPGEASVESPGDKYPRMGQETIHG